MIKRALLYYHTIKHLRWVQVKYRFIYFFKNRWKSLIFNSHNVSPDFVKTSDLFFLPSIPSEISWRAGDVFTFLNISQEFKSAIDWNFSGNGKLWVYNLSYFEFLHQPNFLEIDGKRLIYNFIEKSSGMKDSFEPFPMSLRITNWIKFIAINTIRDKKIDQSLFVQLNILKKNIEYHILGNHLLENGFALLFGGIYFDDNKVLKKAEQILITQLDEQILQDGGHFERSPMYHQIMLFRVLDSINIIKSNPKVSLKLLFEVLTITGSRMISWLRNMTYSNGDIPHLNDSTNGIAPSSIKLFKYADQLGLKKVNISLGDSGYRKIMLPDIELVMDVGEIGPSYQPGHAHCDTFSFELRIRQHPFIVDTGTSSYEKSDRRNLERSTSSHNTVRVGANEQCEAWGGFRVGRRTKPRIVMFSANTLTADLQDFRGNKYKHRRTFRWSENKLDIADSIHGYRKTCQAYIHFHPSIKLNLIKNKLITALSEITVVGGEYMEVQEFEFVNQFNKTMASRKLVISFKDELKISISW